MLASCVKNIQKKFSNRPLGMVFLKYSELEQPSVWMKNIQTVSLTALCSSHCYNSMPIFPFSIELSYCEHVLMGPNP